MSKYYDAGALDQRVSIDRPHRVSDGAGGFEVQWQVVRQVWAHVRPLSGRERNANDRVEATANYLIVMRNRDDVDETMTIVWRGRRLNIRFVKREGHRPMLMELEAEMGAAT